MNDNKNTAAQPLDLDSLRFDHRGALMVPDPTGDYILVPDARALIAQARASQPAEPLTVEVAYDIKDAAGPGTQVIQANSVMRHADGHYTVFIDAPASAQPDRGAAQDEQTLRSMFERDAKTFLGSPMVACTPGFQKDDDGGYQYANTRRWFSFWKAARATVAALSPASQPVAPEAAQAGDDALIVDAVTHNNVYGVLPNSASTMSIGRAVLAAERQLVAHAQQEAAPADCTVDDSELARKVMVFLGRATTASMEPGADPLRDRLAERLARWRPAVAPSDAKDATVPDHSERGVANAGGLSKAEIYTLRRLIECAEKLDERPRPMCRDCADEDGTCPNSSLECDMGKLFADAKSLHDKLVRAAGQEAANAKDAALTQAERDVLAERRRQVEAEGWTPAHDDAYGSKELPRAAAAYIVASVDTGSFLPFNFWPWGDEHWKPTTPRRNLVKAAALLLADIERMDRAAMAAAPSSEKGSDK